jgi:site-specific recombinase XerD
MAEKDRPTVKQAIESYVEMIANARAENTAETYQYALKVFCDVLSENGTDAQKTMVSEIDPNAVAMIIPALKNYSATTERLYLTAIYGFFEYLVSEDLASINLPKTRSLIRMRSRRPGQRLPQFPKDDIEKMIDCAEALKDKPTDDIKARLINLRDRAFLIVLADTGLRVHEACKMRRGDIDWNEGRALVVGKGNREAVVRFSRRAQDALMDYLKARAQTDGNTGTPLTALPCFARHDKGAGKIASPITTETGRTIVEQRAIEFLGANHEGHITPHSFRHYFVTVVLQSSGNLKLAQELARHKNIAVTQRYAHLSDSELDAGYWKVFEDKNGQD